MKTTKQYAIIITIFKSKSITLKFVLGHKCAGILQWRYLGQRASTRWSRSCLSPHHPLSPPLRLKPPSALSTPPTLLHSSLLHAYQNVWHFLAFNPRRLIAELLCSWNYEMNQKSTCELQCHSAPFMLIRLLRCFGHCFGQTEPNRERPIIGRSVSTSL